MRRFFLLLPAAFALMATGAAPNGGAIAHNGNGHGAFACTTCHGASFEGNAVIRAPALALMGEWAGRCRVTAPPRSGC